MCKNLNFTEHSHSSNEQMKVFVSYKTFDLNVAENT